VAQAYAVCENSERVWKISLGSELRERSAKAQHIVAV
jgi:hypothetical protein